MSEALSVEQLAAIRERYDEGTRCIGDIPALLASHDHWQRRAERAEAARNPRATRAQALSIRRRGDGMSPAQLEMVANRLSRSTNIEVQS